MTFPCLVCGDLPFVDQPAPQPSSLGASSSTAVTGGLRLNNNLNNLFSSPTPAAPVSSSTPVSNNNTRKSGGTTIRTLSKDVSDKIFQNLCRHLYVKTEPNWFIQNPGEQMPLCAFCSSVVLEIYTLQSKVDQFQAMIKKMVWKLERIVADTEIAGNWMATREEQERQQEIWNTVPCPPMAIRIARERHHKFRQQILQNFKSKVKLRQKLRAAGQPGDEMYEVEPIFNISLPDSIFNNGDKSEAHYSSSLQSHIPTKRPRWMDDDFNGQNIPGLIRTHLNPSPTPSRSSPGPTNHGGSATTMLRLSQSAAGSQQGASIKIPSSISVSAVGQSARGEQNQEVEEYDSEVEDDQALQVYPDVEYNSNSGDGEESTIEHDSSFWNSTDDNMDEEEAMTIPEGEDVVWLAPGLALRKSFVNQLLSENLKPSVFLRKLVFAVFGMKQVANSSGICGSNKPGAKPSLDRYKFEALREYTIETYGIRDNIAELEDLNRKIRTICCDARKAMKRKVLKTTLSGHSSIGMKSDSLQNPTTTSSSSAASIHSETVSGNSFGHVPDLFHLSTGLLSSGSGGETTRVGGGDNDDDDEEDDDDILPHMPVSVTLEEQPGDVVHH